jgi:hypothetical protein
MLAELKVIAEKTVPSTWDDYEEDAPLKKEAFFAFVEYVGRFGHYP